MATRLAAFGLSFALSFNSTAKQTGMPGKGRGRRVYDVLRPACPQSYPFAFQLKLFENGSVDLVYGDCGGGFDLEPALVEKPLKQRRNYLCLNSVVINFPGTRAGKKCYAWNFKTESHMHGQAVSANQTPVICD